MIRKMLLFNYIVDILWMKLFWIKSSHLLLECHTIQNCLLMIFSIHSFSFTFAHLVKLVFAHLIQFQINFIYILFIKLFLLLWWNAVWSPLLSCIFVYLCGRFSIHFLCDKTIFNNLVYIFSFVAINLLDLIALLNQSYRITHAHLGLLQIVVLSILSLLVRRFEHTSGV